MDPDSTLRQIALNEAIRVSALETPSTEVVEKAAAFYAFLKGETTAKKKPRR